jgi:hypothetical protein
MPPDDTSHPALGEADAHRAAYNDALSRGDRAAAERAFTAEYEALRRAYPSSDDEESPSSGMDDGGEAPGADAVAVTLEAVDADRRDAVREVIDAYAADEEAVWRDWDAILAAHPESDLFERLEDPANDLILAAAWAKSSPHALSLIAKTPSLVTEPAAIEAAIVEARRLFGARAPGYADPAAGSPTSAPPAAGTAARDRWIAQADRARSKMHDAHAQGDIRNAELWSAEERRLLGLAYERSV